MGLHPLEFSECYLDSPQFRDKIKAHEAELDKTNRFIKELYKDGKNLINATKRKSILFVLMCVFCAYLDLHLPFESSSSTSLIYKCQTKKKKKKDQADYYHVIIS